MTKFRERVTNWWPFLLLTGWGFPLITPLLRWTAVTCTHDGHLHYHRVAAMRYAWENGLLFTRWLPDLAFGYGYPFFVYREPLPLYAVLWPHLLGLPLPAASNLFYIIVILACGWFMFLWVRDILGSWGGLVAGMAYMAAPYVLVDALIRGNSPESAALPLFPLLLWAGRRWLLEGKARWFGTAVFGLILLGFSHNISMLIFVPTLGVYLLALAWLHRLSWRIWLARLTLLFGLGLGTTIFYTGGALLELNSVTLKQSTTTRNNDFRFNFTTAAEILAPVAPEDPSLLNPPLPFRLGWVPLGLAVLGVALAIFKRKEISDWRLEIGGSTQSPISNYQSPKEIQFHLWLMVLGTAVFLFMSLPISQFIWEGLPLIDFVQFPWRFVGRAALPLAFLAGLPFSFFQRKGAATGRAEAQSGDWAALFVALAVGLLVLEAMPTVYPNICAEEPFPTINTVHQYERETGLVGVDPEGSYFPRTVKERPSASPLQANYLVNETPQRLVLPPTVEVEAIEYHNLAVTAQINSPEPFTARYLSFDFPGWAATVDGKPVVITPEDPSGLITFPVPAGSHEIAVRWQSTPTRTILLGLSLLSLAGVLVVLLVLIKTQPAVIGERFSVNGLLITDYRLRITDYWPLITVALLLITGKLVLDNVESPLRRVAGPEVAHTAVLQAAELRLAGYNLSETAVPSGGFFDIDLAWTATDFPQARYQSNVWLVGPDGLTWSDLNTFRPRLYEDAPDTRAWQPGQWGWDSREVTILRGTPPGQYDIVLTLFDFETLQPITLLNANGVVVGPTAVLGQITVTEPEPTDAAREALGQIQGISLLEVRQDREAAVPGDVALLTFFWQRPSGNPASDTFNLELRDANDAIAHTWTQPFTLPSYPPAEWLAETEIRGQHLLRLPAALTSGSYQFVADGITLGEIDITAPERVFEAVEMETAVAATFSQNNQPLITLVGLSQSPVSNLQSPISLLWRAEAETPTSYRVFIHLVNADGQILGQADGEPANWSRPTTSWVPGEYILDDHILPLPPDLPPDASLRIGLYNPTTDQRLQTEAGEYVTLPLP
ncbi:hypothetical protein [Candidatus Leptofilum sp.]|uniref:hypothetical protein n=1 Tax=Candidatus Leptofilum sp. TaxID=3241576 RepID=UPI003B591A81